jgi:hypothetical protein
LVGIEPASMTAVICRNAADRKAETWKQQLDPFSRLEFAVSDAAKGIAKAVEQVAQGRREATSSTSRALGHGLDVFHTAKEAHTVLARQWRPAEATWAEAEAADAAVDRARGQGLDARGPAGPARAAWRGATAALERVERLEGAWRRGRAAFESFRADGRLNDRVAAEAEIAKALEGLTDPEWKKVRNFLLDRRSLAFLDRMHQRLARAEPRPEWREAMAWRWWLRHGHPAPTADPMVALMGQVVRQRRLTEPEQGSYDAVAAVLGDTVRASSAVECMNSVLRMQQSRHRRMTQAMLDLKRLYWNSHRFRSGPRKKVCPYRKLGLRLETFDFWELLQADPAQLTQQLSAKGNPI